jgi:hypothetical protein
MAFARADPTARHSAGRTGMSNGDDLPYRSGSTPHSPHKSGPVQRSAGRCILATLDRDKYNSTTYPRSIFLVVLGVVVSEVSKVARRVDPKILILPQVASSSMAKHDAQPVASRSINHLDGGTNKENGNADYFSLPSMS